MFKNLLFGGRGGAGPLADFGLLIVRVLAGLSLAVAHGWGKLPPSAGFIEGTANMGFPAPTFFAWMAALSEFGGGLLLALGLATRPAAFLIACTMATAGFVRHASDPYGKKELALVYLGVALLFLFSGSGRFGLDAWFRRTPNEARGFPVQPK